MKRFIMLNDSNFKEVILMSKACIGNHVDLVISETVILFLPAEV